MLNQADCSRTCISNHPTKEPAPEDPVPATVGRAIGYNHNLAQYGYSATDAMFNDWWRVWKRRSNGRTSIAAELMCIASGRTAPAPASRQIRDWVHSWDPGWTPPESICPEHAHHLLNVLKGFRQVTDQHKPPAHIRPPCSNRVSIHRTYKVGRAVYKARLTTAGLKDEDGSLITCARKTDSLLWNSRKAIWTSDPPQGCAAGPILDHYFGDSLRTADLPAHPAPSLSSIAQHIQRCGGSAPGVDNRPYEVYHHGVSFVATLIGQAFHIADLPQLDVAQTLGPSIDLGVWIPKKEGADTTSGQRPLQLPSYLRRIFGGCIMAVVGPAVEPLLSAHQSAIR